MKRILYILLAVVLMLPMTGFGRPDQSPTESAKRVISGVVSDRETRTLLQHVAVVAVGSNVGTVTNADGEFSLKVTEEELKHGLKFSYIGYVNMEISPEEIDRQQGVLRIRMIPAALAVNEVTIYGGKARDLIREAISRIPDNYSDKEHLYTTFYRETVQKRRSHIAVSEAVMDLYKTDYETRSIYRDKVRLRKGRRLMNYNENDTLAVKIVGGPSFSLAMDIAKNSEEFLSYEQMDNYEFTLGAPVMLDNRMQHVVHFKPCVKLPYALFSGVIHLDQEYLSISRVEMHLDVSDLSAATAVLLHRKPFGLRFKPYGLSFMIGYRLQGDRAYLNYVRSEFRFKCDWKKRFFSSTYTALSEMVMVDREENPEIIRHRERFRKDQIFYDEVDAYADPNYWQDYNILEPTESLENAVNRLRKRAR